MADYLDNFIDPNGTLIENHTADTGQRYAAGSDFKIQDNRLYADLPDGTYFSEILESDGVTSYISDSEFDFEFDYRLIANQGNLGFLFCATDTDNAYFVFVLKGASLNLRTVVGGANTTLYSQPISTTAQSTGSVKIEVRANTLELFLDGVSVFGPTTNTDHARAGKVFLRTSEPEGPASGWAFDSASVTSVATATPTITDIDGDESVYPGQSYVIQATDDIGATQGTVFWERLDGTDDVQHTVTNWDAATDQITVTAVRGGHNYESGLYQARVVLGDGTTEILFDNAGAGLTLEAQPDTFAVTAASPNTTDDASLWTGLVDTATGDPVTVVDGDQAWVKTTIDGLSIAPDGTISANVTGTFTVQFWRASEGVWGSDQTVSFTLPEQAVGGLKRAFKSLLKSNLKTSLKG